MKHWRKSPYHLGGSKVIKVIKDGSRLSRTKFTKGRDSSGQKIGEKIKIYLRKRRT